MGESAGHDRSWRRWLQSHLFDVVAMPFGIVATLRVWLVMFDVHDRTFISAAGCAVVCDILHRIAEAHRVGERPHLFSGSRRRDLVTAIFLTVGPRPIALPLNDGSPFAAAWHAVTFPGWTKGMAAACLLGIAAWRLTTALFVFAGNRVRRRSGLVSVIDKLRSRVEDMAYFKRSSDSIDSARPGGVIARAIAFTSQLCCTHTYLRRSGGGRMWLECADCGLETPGIHTAAHVEPRDVTRRGPLQPAVNELW